MEALAAVSLVGTIITFVDFVGKLVTTASGVRGSATGITEEKASLDIICHHLQRCCFDLSGSHENTNTENSSPRLRTTCESVRELARAVHLECEALLEAIESLKPTQDFSQCDNSLERRYKSFQAAIRAVLSSGKISGIEKRLDRTQRTLMTSLASISCLYQAEHQKKLELLNISSLRWHMKQEEQMEQIRNILNGFRISSTKWSERRPQIPPSIQKLEEGMKAVSLGTHDVEFQQRVVGSLHFESRQARFDTIQASHDETLHWVLSECDHEANHEANHEADHEAYHRHGYRCRLFRWLQLGSGIFWISGKPGSGKSTLMKYVASHSQTIKLLEKWAGPQDVAIASHYFWLRGTEMQRSQLGLLRTLLFDIFRQCPQLAGKLCKKVFLGHGSEDELSDIVWTLPTLRKVLGYVAAEPDLPVRICFLIDGLDEYQGDHLDLCRDLIELGKSAHIKLCVSSRPWNDFEDSFAHSGENKFYMQDVNREDIRKFSAARLSEHPRWDSILQWSPETSTLVDEITSRSQGVFLWVFLVLKLLREGLGIDDSLPELRRRLYSFPSDLEEFFREILESVPPLDQTKMAGALRIAHTADEPLDLLVYYFFELELRDEVSPTHETLEALSQERQEQLRRLMARRINGYCRGLLETERGTVDFLHRTVADFLGTQDVSEMLIAKCTPQFAPAFSILRGLTAIMKNELHFLPDRIPRFGHGDDSIEKLETHIERILCHAANLQIQCKDEIKVRTLELLSEIRYALRGTFRYKFGKDFECAAEQYFTTGTIKHRLPEYLAELLAENRYSLNYMDPPALSTLLESSSGGDRCTSLLVETLRVLLQHGQDPNQRYQPNREDLNRTDSPWTAFFKQGVHQRSIPSDYLGSGIFQLFLKYGADPNALLVAPCGNKVSTITTVWSEFLQAGFSIKDLRSEVHYLEILDIFIKRGASMLWARNVGSATLDFFGRLQSEGFEGNMRVLQKIVNKLLMGSVGFDWPRDQVWDIIARVFGSDTLKSIQLSYAQNEAATAAEDGAKRPRGSSSSPELSPSQSKKVRHAWKELNSLGSSHGGLARHVNPLAIAPSPTALEPSEQSISRCRIAQ